jgi:hypothetical protein
MDTDSCPGVKRPGCGDKFPAQFNADVKEIVEIHLCSPSVFMAGYRMEFTFAFYCYILTVPV